MRSGFWKADGFLGLAVVVLFALFNWMSDLLPGLERNAYGLALQSFSRAPSDMLDLLEPEGLVGFLERAPACARRCPPRPQPGWT